MNITAVIEPKESQIQKQIVGYLELKGYEVIRHNAGKVKYNVTGAKKGMPDLEALIGGGISVFVEVKTKKGKLSEDQKKMQKRLRDLGHKVIVARKLEDVRNI
ncbi:MAG: VRR-NUC domain-containing protein [Spirochaetaceae bacterium]|nr:VRR-NUC domain-containing protein [Spirochaetaceae bacterium]